MHTNKLAYFTQQQLHIHSLLESRIILRLIRQASLECLQNNNQRVITEPLRIVTSTSLRGLILKRENDNNKIFIIPRKISKQQQQLTISLTRCSILVRPEMTSEKRYREI
jgi:hypothetical protein